MYLDILKKRRSYYNIGKNLPISEEDVITLVTNITEAVPDAFNMKSSRVLILFGENHDKLWDNIYDVFEGKVPREKLDSFKAGAGTILYFYDEDVIKNMQKEYETYADNFPVWANQASGMLQHAIWCGLRNVNIGASLQHYNPVIDDMVHKTFDVPGNYKLIAQMPFGSIEKEADPKPSENGERIRVIR